MRAYQSVVLWVTIIATVVGLVTTGPKGLLWLFIIPFSALVGRCVSWVVTETLKAENKR